MASICIWYVYGNLVCVREMTCLVLNFQIPPKFELMLLSFVLLLCHARDQERIDVQDRMLMFHVGVHSLHSLIHLVSHFPSFVEMVLQCVHFNAAIHDTSSMMHPSSTTPQLSPTVNFNCHHQSS